MLSAPVFDKQFAMRPEVRVVMATDIHARLSAWQTFVARQSEFPLHADPMWLLVLAEGRGHVPYCVEAVSGGEIVGVLPLALVTSPFFGRFLVSLPHLSGGGVCCDDLATSLLLVDKAIELANALDVDFLELRNERLLPHTQLQHVVTDKAHMRLALPSDEGQLWDQLRGKVRNQVRKAEQFHFHASWGGRELLGKFYALYTRRMRDLGSPTDGKILFDQILKGFPCQAELLVVRQQNRSVATAMLLHGQGTTEIHRSATIVDLRSTALNTWMHWQCLMRTLERGNHQFDFGRPTVGTSVYTFKKRFGATAHPAAVQHYIRRGSPGDLRRNDGKFKLSIKLWSCLPLGVTRWLGPLIANGLP